MTDLTTLHQQGKLSQTCPACGLTEAAGFYCTKCSTRTGPADWFRGTDSEAQAAAKKARALGRQSTSDRAANPAETAIPADLGLA